MNTLIAKSDEMPSVEPTRGGVRDWQRWTPYAAVAWSLFYAALGLYLVVSGHGFSFTPVTLSDGMGPLVGRFGQDVSWIVVMIAGFPAAVLGVAMLRGIRALRPLLITAGILLAGVSLPALRWTVETLLADFKELLGQPFSKSWSFQLLLCPF